MLYPYRRSVEELMDDEGEKLVIDLRKAREFNMGTIEGAVNVYWEDFDAYLPNLPKDKPVYLLCYTGATSDEIAENLSRQGYEIYSITGGYRNYFVWQMQNG